MLKYMDVLKNTKIFAGLKEDEIGPMLGCLNARISHFKKGEYVLRQGQQLSGILILVEGLLHIQQDDYWGRRSILGDLEPGDMFGEAYAAAEDSPLINDVVALADSAVIFLELDRVLKVCSSACRFHSAVVQNLFFAISEKNRGLVQKLGHMSRRSTREKLMSYLSGQAAENSSSDFFIPFNRQQMADYLSLDRSAMSAELCRMRDEGLIDFRKNHFTLLQGK